MCVEHLARELQLRVFGVLPGINNQISSGKLPARELLDAACPLLNKTVACILPPGKLPVLPSRYDSRTLLQPLGFVASLRTSPAV